MDSSAGITQIHTQATIYYLFTTEATQYAWDILVWSGSWIMTKDCVRDHLLAEIENLKQRLGNRDAMIAWERERGIKPCLLLPYEHWVGELFDVDKAIERARRVALRGKGWSL